MTKASKLMTLSALMLLSGLAISAMPSSPLTVKADDTPSEGTSAEGEDTPSDTESPDTSAEEEEAPVYDYFVCISTENYAKRSSHKMTLLDDGEYELDEVYLPTGTSFYVGGSDGSRYGDSKGESFLSDEKTALTYTVRFNPKTTYNEEKDGFKATSSHVTYKLYEKQEYSISVNGTDTPLTYNPYQSAYDCYYISSIDLKKDDVVAYEKESHVISADGSYRILFTPGKEVGLQKFLFDENGNYGTGSDYQYHIYIEDAPAYFLSFHENLLTKAEPTDISNTEKGYSLTRDESVLSPATYNSEPFYVGEEDLVLHYSVYEKEEGGYKRLGEDEDKKGKASMTLTIADRGWYTFSFTDVDNNVAVTYKEETASYNGFYIASDLNGYLYGDNGDILLDDKYEMKEITESQEYYEEDYKQYRYDLVVPRGGMSFYITDGENKYKNGTKHIEIEDAGDYTLLFSDEHVYGLGRHYKFSKVDPEKDTEEVLISTAKGWNEFADKCNASASYSQKKIVRLTKDIDFSSTSLTPISYFQGTLDAGFHSFRNVYFDKDSSSYNIFNTLAKDGCVERLNIENAHFDCLDNDYVGVIGHNYGEVYSCSISGLLKGRRYVGFAAENGRSEYKDNETSDSTKQFRYGKLAKITSTAVTSGANDVGGIAGLNLGEITSSKNEGTLLGQSSNQNITLVNLGGIAGYSAGKISDVENKASVSSSNSAIYVGGIAGVSNGEIYFATNDASVTADRYVGGISGYYGKVEQNNADLEKYFNAMGYEDFMKEYFPNEEELDEQYDGAKAVVDYSANYGEVLGKSNVGGIIGFNSSADLSLTHSLNNGHVKGSVGENVGGIAGSMAKGSIKECLASSLVEGKKHVGGIAGVALNVASSYSSAEVSGEDYVGGIAGTLSGDMTSCISNVEILNEDASAHKGALLGEATTFVSATNSFSTSIKWNYYVGSLGGIDKAEYDSSYDDAAKALAPEALASNGSLSPNLSLHFDAEAYQAGEDSKAYPELRCFEEVKDNDAYGDESSFKSLFDAHKDKMSEVAKKNSRIAYLVSFMEFREENGDLYKEDGSLNKDAYSLNSYVRLFAGEKIEEAPAFLYASEKDGYMIYSGDKASYFASWDLPSDVDSSMKVYARYEEVSTSLFTSDSKVIVTGLFKKGTSVILEETYDGYILRFYCDGKEISVKDVNVKFEMEEGATLYKGSGAKLAKIDSKYDSGRYLFTYSTGERFSYEMAKKEILPTWAWLTLAAASGTVLVLLVWLIVSIAKKAKAKKEAKKVEESKKSAEEEKKRKTEERIAKMKASLAEKEKEEIAREKEQKAKIPATKSNSKKSK